MGALTKFESFVENLLEGSLTRMLRGQLQPVEIAKRLTRVMEGSKTISVGRVFVANEYYVHLSPGDFQRLESVRATMERELAEYLAGVARERRLSLLGRPLVKLQSSEKLLPRQVRVEARLAEDYETTSPAAGEPSPAEFGQTRRFDAEQLKRSLRNVVDGAALVATSGPLGGMRYCIDKPTITIGRGLGNDIVIDDPRVSRQHAELRITGGKVCIYDLKSTNGTWVNGRRVIECVLSDGDSVSLGGVEYFFKMGPEP